MKTYITIALLTIAALLTACGSKPPGCTDPEVSDTAKILLAGELASGKARIAQDDPAGLIPAFLQGMKVQFSGVVDDGYQSDAKKQLCKAKLRVTYENGDGFERQVEYTTQRTIDDKNNFVLELGDAIPLMQAVYRAADAYYEGHRWSGEWQGDYACGGIRRATDGPDGPFKIPVTLLVEGHGAVLERTIADAGYESLKGSLGAGYLKLRGKGANSPEDKWEVMFDGEVKAGVLHAEGQTRVPDGEHLRACALELKQVASSKP